MESVWNGMEWNHGIMESVWNGVESWNGMESVGMEWNQSVANVGWDQEWNQLEEAMTHELN